MIDQELLSKLNAYLREHYIPEEFECLTSYAVKEEKQARKTSYYRPSSNGSAHGSGIFASLQTPEICDDEEDIGFEDADYAISGTDEDSVSIEDWLRDLDESFSVSLLKLIDRKGMSDSECYNKANIDRRLFSKIRSDRYYKPSKQTALALCVALELNLQETDDLLKKAGYALSPSSKADAIVRFFIENRKYDLYQIDQYLLHYDQKPLSNY